MTYYAVTCYETGTIIDAFNTREEAVEALQSYEEQDIEEGIYEAGTYYVQLLKTL